MRFQGSKVFENGGPFIDIFSMPPLDAKRISACKTQAALPAFNFGKGLAA